MAVGERTSAFGALARAEASGAPYSLVILDSRMPDRDGIILAGEILARHGSSIRVILLSSDDDPALATQSREAGIRACLLKPALPSDLLETISVAMNRADDNSRDVSHSPSALHGSGRILIAEDNELDAGLLRMLLSKRGYHTEFADDGRTALELAAETRFDLLLLDLHMPEMDGFEVTRRIRKREETTGHLPIIALTARSSSRDRDRCLADGMDDFLSKPIEAEVLWSAIARLVDAAPTRYAP